MGLDTNVYVGPFARCLNEIVTVQESVTICANRACGEYRKHKGTKFCGECGRIIQAVPVPRHKLKVCHTDILREFSAVIQLAKNTSPPGLLPGLPENTDIWIPKQPASFARLFNLRLMQTTFFTPTAETAKEDMQLFRTHFQEVIEFLAQLYGDKGVAFGWGVMAFVI